jgi:hypothetical protein
MTHSAAMKASEWNLGQRAIALVCAPCVSLSAQSVAGLAACSSFCFLCRRCLRFVCYVVLQPSFFFGRFIPRRPADPAILSAPFMSPIRPSRASDSASLSASVDPPDGPPHSRCRHSRVELAPLRPLKPLLFTHPSIHPRSCINLVVDCPLSRHPSLGIIYSSPCRAPSVSAPCARIPALSAPFCTVTGLFLCRV